ncbi:MAG: hypothetical protein K6U02_01140 [Firmicutes bacterium]|nr:hypothetical protein [Bacillota bacterium]
MKAATPNTTHADRELDPRLQARLDAEIARLREQSQKAIEAFQRNFPPPTEEQIERLLYPELSEFTLELGGRRFVLRELPALTEKKFLRLVEHKLPALVAEILRFDERLGEDPAQAFAQLLTRAESALDLVAETCALVLDPSGEQGIDREFVQAHASTARQFRILQAQLLLNAGRDFLSRLFPVLTPPETGPPADPSATPDNTAAIHNWPPPSAGWSSSVKAPAPSSENSPWDSLP